VNLWRVASASSAPWLGEGLGDMEDEDNEEFDKGDADEEDAPDVRVSTSASAWSCGELSIFDWIY
jgi:hypothetical protein